jgi:hypothetical protein
MAVQIILGSGATLLDQLALALIEYRTESDLITLAGQPTAAVAATQSALDNICPAMRRPAWGNYFRAEMYREGGWNTWREADYLLRDLREDGRVAFAAVDSSILETAPDDLRGGQEPGR